MAWVGTVNRRPGSSKPAAFAGFEDGYLGRIHITTADALRTQAPPDKPCASAVIFCAAISPTIHGSCLAR